MARLLLIGCDPAPRQALIERGHRVESAPDVSTGRARLETGAFDLVVVCGGDPGPELHAVAQARRAETLIQAPAGPQSAPAATSDGGGAAQATTSHEELLRLIDDRLTERQNEHAVRRQLGHDLRGPVSIVAGHAELLQSIDVSANPASADIIESIEAIADAAARLHRIIADRVEPPPPND